MLSLLLVGNEHRGNDATGLAISQNDGTVDVFKNDCPAWIFVSSQQYLDFIKDYLVEDSWAVILHTRGATIGNPRNNNNNHPMFKDAAAVVHNGGIQNDSVLFRSLNMDRNAETDSDILRAFVDRYGITEQCIREMNQICGNGAGSAIHPNYPHKLMLFRSGNPMILGSNDNFLVWSSEKGTIHKAMRPFIQRFGMDFQAQRPDIAFAPMPDDTAWIIGEKGLEYHGKFKIISHKYTEPFRKTYEEYPERQARWDRMNAASQNNNKITSIDSYKKEDYKDAYCPDCKMEWLIPKDKLPFTYACKKGNKGCGALHLIDKPIVVVN